MRRVKSREEGQEEGIVVLWVLGMMTVMFGMLGFVVDVGIARQERRELQNGADAGALAMAQECALGLCTNLVAKAQPYANSNSIDGTSTVTGVSLPTGSSVKVDTRTRTTGGATSLTTKFAYLFGRPSTSVTATATAAWGAPGGGTAVPLTISYCQWKSLTGNGTTYPTANLTIFFHDPSPATSCSGPAGQTTPGGFGWLNSTSCVSTITSGGQVGSDPGNSAPQGCSPAQVPLNTDLLIPVFQTVTGTGNNAVYTIYGLATFHMLSRRLGGNGNQWTSNPAPPNPPCTNADRCIYGFFVKDIIPWTGGPIGGGPNLGTLAVKLTA